MKKLLIVLLTFVLVASYSQMFAFAEDNDVNQSIEIPSTEDSSTEDSSTEDSTTEDSTTEDSTTEDSTTEDSTTEDSSTEDSTTEDSSTEDSSTEDSTSEDSTSEDSSLDKGENKETGIEIDFTTDRLPTALEHMGVGLAGVMLVLILIGVVVFVLNKFFKP